MKICAIICEFNPFHNGHRYLLESVLESCSFDGILCVMSGHFTQRGDRAIADKFTRAKHAVYGGADCVAELPAPFAVAPAPVFAAGAVKIISSVPEVCALAFGCEHRLDFKEAAKKIDESGEFKAALNCNLKKGESYAKSYSLALRNICKVSAGGANDILALEYAKAVLKYRPELELMPVERVGAGHNDAELGGTYASASAIRSHLDDDGVRACVPGYVIDDIKRDASAEGRADAILSYAAAAADADGISAVYGGGEGLANKIKGLCGLSAAEIVAECTSRRYPSSRIRRVLTQVALKLTAEDTNRWLDCAGYIKPLAVKRGRADEMLKALARSSLPVVITGSDAAALTGENARLYAASAFADRVWGICAGREIYDHTIIKV